MKPLLSLALCTALAGCGRTRSHADDLESYEPDATEVPLSDDFERAARKRVRAENYRAEIDRIERELKLERRAE